MTRQFDAIVIGLGAMGSLACYHTALLERTYQLWGELEREAGRRLLYLVGGLYMGDPDYDAIRGSIRTAQDHRLAHEVLDRRQIAERFPQFRLPEGCIGVYEPTAGWVPPEQAVCAACHCAMLRGAEMHGHEPVLDWQEAPGGACRCKPRRGPTAPTRSCSAAGRGPGSWSRAWVFRSGSAGK
jgi:glycine/D-amino acid oxidase-like deaminating enzyme